MFTLKILLLSVGMRGTFVCQTESQDFSFLCVVVKDNILGLLY